MYIDSITLSVLAISILTIPAVAFVCGCIALAVAGQYDLEGGGQRVHKQADKRVQKGSISAEEYAYITGEEYPDGEGA